jgi:hypothetical protein
MLGVSLVVVLATTVSCGGGGGERTRITAADEHAFSAALAKSVNQPSDVYYNAVASGDTVAGNAFRFTRDGKQRFAVEFNVMMGATQFEEKIVYGGDAVDVCIGTPAAAQGHPELLPKHCYETLRRATAPAVVPFGLASLIEPDNPTNSYTVLGVSDRDVLGQQTTCYRIRIENNNRYEPTYCLGSEGDLLSIGGTLDGAALRLDASSVRHDSPDEAFAIPYPVSPRPPGPTPTPASP